MTTKNFRTYFFHVGSEDEQVFEDRLQEIYQTPLENRSYNDARIIDLKNEISGNKIYISGDIERLHMENIPSKSSLTEEPDDLDLDDDEGLGYNTAFVYYKEKQILGMQSNIQGVTYARLRDYINNCISGDPSFFYINPIIIEDDKAFRVLQNDVYASFKKIEFTVDNPERYNYIPDGEQGSIFKDFIRNADATNAITMKVSLISARSKESFLNNNRVVNLIKTALSSGLTKKLKGKASIDGGDNQVLDFLPNKLQYLGEVNVTRNQVSFQERKRSIIRAFQFHQKYIDSRE